MLAAHRSGPDADRAHHDGGIVVEQAEVAERYRAADHVGDGVERADFVEVDLVDSRAVHARLRLGERGESAHGQ